MFVSVTRISEKISPFQTETALFDNLIASDYRKRENLLFALLFRQRWLYDHETFKQSQALYTVTDKNLNTIQEQQGIVNSAAVLVLLLNTKGLLISSIYVNIALFSTQRVFCIKHLCQYCIVLDTQRMSRTKGLMFLINLKNFDQKCYIANLDLFCCVSIFLG